MKQIFFILLLIAFGSCSKKTSNEQDVLDITDMETESKKLAVSKIESEPKKESAIVEQTEEGTEEEDCVFNIKG